MFTFLQLIHIRRKSIFPLAILRILPRDTGRSHVVPSDVTASSKNEANGLGGRVVRFAERCTLAVSSGMGRQSSAMNSPEISHTALQLSQQSTYAPVQRVKGLFPFIFVLGTGRRQDKKKKWQVRGTRAREIPNQQWQTTNESKKINRTKINRIKTTPWRAAPYWRNMLLRLS